MSIPKISSGVHLPERTNKASYIHACQSITKRITKKPEHPGRIPVATRPPCSMLGADQFFKLPRQQH